jgi:hypothetical protein
MRRDAAGYDALVSRRTGLGAAQPAAR